jgi:hypothetical protein
MKVEKINKSNVSYYVEVVNELIKNIEESSKSLFELFYEAYKSLTTDEFENEFVPNLKMDKSSINKMKKICKSDFIMRNRDKLPNSWANLYVLVTVDESEIQKLIDNGEITTETTKKKILELRDKINSPIDEDEYDNLVGESANDEGDDEEEVNDNSITKRNKEWIARGMPECNNYGDDDSYRKLVIRFKSEDDFLDFTAHMNNLKLNNKTKSIWYSK